MEIFVRPEREYDSRTVERVIFPRIAGQPVKQVLQSSDIVSFLSISADTDTVAFRWKFRAPRSPGATGDSLLLTNVSVAERRPYSVVVTSIVGNLTSASRGADDYAATRSQRPHHRPLLNVCSDPDGSVTVTP